MYDVQFRYTHEYLTALDFYFAHKQPLEKKLLYSWFLRVNIWSSKGFLCRI